MTDPKTDPKTDDADLLRFDYEIKVGARYYTDEIAATDPADAEKKLRTKYKERGEVTILTISPA